MIKTKSKKVAFYTFGCRLNQAETAIMQQGFRNEPVEIVDYKNNPDIVVVNTCTVTANGDADTRKFVNKAKRINPNVEIALVGCQAQVQKEKLLELPNVKWVIGNERKMDIAEIFKNAVDEKPQLITPTIQRKSFTIPFIGFDNKHTRANLKIQDGCDFFCSFCEIPYARGRARSRDFDDIINEATFLANAGHHEQILTGINIGTYNFEDKKLVDVLDALEEIDNIWRIRISSIEPTTIDPKVVEKSAAGGKFCRYLHIPLQSGSETILKAMMRKYTIAEFNEFVQFCYDSNPQMCLGTDVIVGFPGETDQLFEETYQLLLESPFAYFHVFSYSDRDHARSSKNDESDKIDRQIIAKRSKQLRDLSDRKKRVYQQQFLNTTQYVLFESCKNGIWSGLTDTFIRVKVKSDKPLKNKHLPVKISGQEINGMIGVLK